MSAKFEREIKLTFSDAATARAAVLAIGAIPRRARRLQHDCLLDTANGLLMNSLSTLRVRAEDGRGVVTFKGPVQPGTMKVREEIETEAGDAGILLAILERLGLAVWFRYEKYREEFSGSEVVIAVDETPIGTFVELEGSEPGVARAAHALGRGPDAYITASYRGLFARHCEERGLPVTDMLFGHG
jgi:adenylate cyclase class 2